MWQTKICKTSVNHIKRKDRRRFKRMKLYWWDMSPTRRCVVQILPCPASGEVTSCLSPANRRGRWVRWWLYATGRPCNLDCVRLGRLGLFVSTPSAEHTCNFLPVCLHCSVLTCASSYIVSGYWYRLFDLLQRSHILQNSLYLHLLTIIFVSCLWTPQKWESIFYFF